MSSLQKIPIESNWKCVQTMRWCTEESIVGRDTSKIKISTHNKLLLLKYKTVLFIEKKMQKSYIKNVRKS